MNIKQSGVIKPYYITLITISLTVITLGTVFYGVTNKQLQKQEQIKQNVEIYQKSNLLVQNNPFDHYPFLNPQHMDGVADAKKHLISYLRHLSEKDPEKLEKLLFDIQSNKPFLRYSAFAQILNSLSDPESKKSFVRAHDEDFFRLQSVEFPYDPVCMFADQTMFFEAFPESDLRVKTYCALGFLTDRSQWNDKAMDMDAVRMLLTMYPKLAFDLFELRNHMQKAQKDNNKLFMQTVFTKTEQQILGKSDLTQTLDLMNRMAENDNGYYAELKNKLTQLPIESKLSDNIQYVMDFIVSKYPQYGKNKAKLAEYFNKGLNQPLSEKKDYPDHFTATFLEWGIEYYAHQSQNYPIMLPMWDKKFIHISTNSNKVFAVASSNNELDLIKNDFRIEKINTVQERFLGGQHLKVIPTRTFAKILDKLLPETNKLNLIRMIDEANHQAQVFDKDENAVSTKSLFWWEFINNLPIHELFEIMKNDEHAHKQGIQININDTGSLNGNIQAWNNEYRKRFNQTEQEKINHESSIKGFLEFE